MIIQLERNIKEKDKKAIQHKLGEIRYKPNEVNTQKGSYIIGIGKPEFDIRELGSMKGISDIHIVSDDYQLVSRKWKVEPTVIDLGHGVLIGEGQLSIMSGLPLGLVQHCVTSHVLPSASKPWKHP